MFLDYSCDTGITSKQDEREIMDTIICTKCQTTINPLEEFPGRVCLECHAIAFDAQPVMTSEQLADMFRNTVN